MISFKPTKNRAFRGSNSYERFGQSILNKYQFSSKPYLGMLNLLFLDTANEHSEDSQAQLYNFIVQLRLQLERQQHNKENNLSASSPFLYKMLERILIRQSLQGSELRSYRRYITHLNINDINRIPEFIRIPSKKPQVSHPIMGDPTDLGIVSKAVASIFVNPARLQLDRSTIPVDHQLNDHYRKPLIESIWLKRITRMNSDSKLLPLVNKLYRHTENYQPLHTMNAVERIVLNNQILQQVYEYGIRQDVIKAKAYIETKVLTGRLRTSTNPNMLDQQKLSFIHNYRRQLTQDFWHNQVMISSQRLMRSQKSYHHASENWRTGLTKVNYRMKHTNFEASSIFDYKMIAARLYDTQQAFTFLTTKGIHDEIENRQENNSSVSIDIIKSKARIVENTTDYVKAAKARVISKSVEVQKTISKYRKDLTQTIWKMHGRNVKITHESANVFDVKWIKQKVSHNHEVIRYLQDTNTHDATLAIGTGLDYDVLTVVKSLVLSSIDTSVQNEHNDQRVSIRSSQDVNNRQVLMSYRRQLSETLLNKQVTNEYVDHTTTYSTLLASKNKRMFPKLSRFPIGDIFDTRQIERTLVQKDIAFQYLRENDIELLMRDSNIQLQKPVQLTLSQETLESSLDMTEIIKSLTTVVDRKLRLDNAAAASVRHSISRISDVSYLRKQYHRQLVDSIWSKQLQENQQSSLINRTMSTSIFDQAHIVERLRANREVIQYLAERGNQASKTVELSYSSVSLVNSVDMTSVVKSRSLEINRDLNVDRTSMIDRTSNTAGSTSTLTEMTNDITAHTNEELVVTRNAMKIRKQYHRQLSDSIWLIQMFASQIVEQTASTNIFDLKFIEERLHNNHNVIAHMTKYGMKINKSVEIPYSIGSDVHSEDVTGVTKSLTSLVNRSSNRIMDEAVVVISNAKTIKKHYHRQLAESIWNTRMIDKLQSSQLIEQSTTTNIFDQQFIKERLLTNRRAMSYMIESGVTIHQAAELTQPIENTHDQADVLNIVKSLTRIIDRNTKEDTISTINRRDMIESVQLVSKQYRRQLAESVWISSMIDTRKLETLPKSSIELLKANSATISRRNQRMMNFSKVSATTSIFDYQIVVDRLISNQKQIDYMIDSGVNMKNPVTRTNPSQVSNHSIEVLDIVKSLTTMNNRSSIEANFNIEDNRSIVNETARTIKQFKRRLSDSIWMSKMLETSQSYISEQQSNYSTRIARRNKRILHKTITTVSSEVFDQKVIEERMNANRRALKYMLDYGAPIHREVELVTPRPNMEPDQIQEVVSAVTKIEFGHSTIRNSLNKLFIQQYRRQLSESIWIKQIQENTLSSSKMRIAYSQRDMETFLTDNYLQKIEEVNNRITHRSLGTKTTDIFNNRLVEQRLQHNKIAVQHLQELGISMNSPTDLLQLRQTPPVIDVVRAVSLIVAQNPSSLKDTRNNNVVPLGVLRQYRKQLTDSITTERLILHEIRSYKLRQQSTRVKVTNPIVQVLHQKVSGSVFDPIVMNERIYRDIESVRRSSHISNHSIEQRREALLSWLLPKSSPAEAYTDFNTIIENRRTSRRPLLRRLEMIRTNHHQLDTSTLETIRAYTTSLFSSAEIDYLNNTISGNSPPDHRLSQAKHNIYSANLMNTKLTLLQGVVDHLAKSTTVSHIGLERLTTDKQRLIRKQLQTSLQHLLIVPEQIVQSRDSAKDQPISFVHSSPSATLDTLNDEWTHRIDREASLDYLIPKPAAVEAPPAPTIKPVEFDVQVDHDKLAINPLNNIDMTELVDKLYSEIERKMAFEQQRRGF